MTIQRKLYYGFGSLAVVLILLFVINTVAALRERSARAAASAAMVNMQFVESLRFQLMQNRLFERNYLLSGNPDDEKKAEKGIQDLSDMIAKGQTTPGTEIIRPMLTRIAPNERSWAENFAMPLIAKRHQVDSGNSTVAELQVFYLQKIPGSWVSESAIELDEMSRTIRETLDDSTASAARAASANTTVSSVGTILGIVVGLVIVTYIARSITRPLKATIVVLQDIAQGDGDLTQRVDEAREDELGELGKWFNTFIGKLEAIIAQIAESTQGVASASEELVAVSQQMGHNTQETSTQATAVAATTEEATRNLVAVATATEEMTASIREIAKNASDAAHVSAVAVQKTEAATATMGRLSQSSEEIGGVVKLITSIAQQTKLLSLNATIEAARAGTAGKGFAVVANEVKELANETAKATEQITQRIEAIQMDTGKATEALTEISGVIARMNDISGTIATAVEEQTATTNEIARNVTQTAEATREVTKKITTSAV